MKLSEEKNRQLKIKASEIREKTVQLIYHAGGGHIGGDLSETEILIAILDLMHHDPKNPNWDGRDYFILSKGHSAETYYVLLADYGYIGQKELDADGSFGALLGGHPNKKIPGVEANTGSLGHGLGFGTGVALGLKMNGKENHVYVVTGDGELAEGSNWEAAMSATKFRLDNLTWIVDRNRLQISGNTEDVMPIDDLQKKTEAFGFKTVQVNGHDFPELYEALSMRETGKPVCIIANTVKGKGLKPAENQAGWHHKTPTAEQMEEMEQEMADYRESLK